MTRALIFALGLTGSCAARSPAAPAAPTSSAPAPVVFTELTDGVWMHTAVRDLADWGPVPSNGLIVVDGPTSILVDTAWDDAQTEAILDWATDVLHHPITRAVSTHAHDDKMGGVGALQARHVTTFAHPMSNAAAPGRGLTPAEHALSFDADGTSHDLAPLVVFFPGGAHTLDNVVVDVPGAGVLFGGCMIRPAGATNLGNTADGDVAHWAAATRAVAERFPEASIVVPSHGPPGGRALLDLTIRLASPGSE